MPISPLESTPRRPDSSTTFATSSIQGPYMSANAVVPERIISMAAQAAPI